MTANDIWTQSTVPNGPAQFFATVMVLQYLQGHYHNLAAHKQRVLEILAARQRGEL